MSFDCQVEAQPKPIAYWTRNDQTAEDQVLLSSRRVHAETSTNGYKSHMKLTVHQMELSDLGLYRCVAKNSLGKAEGSVQIIGAVSSFDTSISFD